MPSTSGPAHSGDGAAQESERAPSSEARPAAAAAATRAFSPSNSSRLPKPTITTRLPLTCVTASFFSPALASPESTSCCSSGSSRDSPSNRPITRVSASVSPGAPLRALTPIGDMRAAVYNPDGGAFIRVGALEFVPQSDQGD